MKHSWYLSRLRKMSAVEVFKRARELIYINFSRIKYSNPAKCHYSRFSGGSSDIKFQALPSTPIPYDWKHYRIYALEFDLTRSLDWFFVDKDSPIRWPQCHFAGINYRPGNPYGDVRINWELNRLQFLPAMAASNPELAKRILFDWLERNPFLHGPGYLASMEVALRWISIYWAACLLENSMDFSMRRKLLGLAIASGNYIEHRLSTHSSAGNHLIVEAVGLFWLGKALQNKSCGRRWISEAREILGEQVVRQINSDGSNREQSFWYLGFVVDALLHYMLLEERNKIADGLLQCTEKALEFINEMILPNGLFPDYGDRDDGVVFRCSDSYDETPFGSLLNIGAIFFNRSGWARNSMRAKERLRFWQNDMLDEPVDALEIFPREASCSPRLKIYPDGGMTLMQWGKGRLLFRHAPLGMENTCGHGHADALSVIFYWNSLPVLIDLGSGQYNGDQAIRKYFRSTIAHNTVEIGGKNQARITGPFMWQKSYKTKLLDYGISPVLFAKARHNGYLKNFSTFHTRMIEWVNSRHINIHDSFCHADKLPLRGAFHLGPCHSVKRGANKIFVNFREFSFSFLFPTHFSIEIFYGSNNPFFGWQTTVYGKWEPSYSIIFSTSLLNDHKYVIGLKINET